MTDDKRSYNKWTHSRRIRLERLCKQEYTGREIAKMMGVSHTTISRELQRCPKGKYNAKNAQKDADIKKLGSANSNRTNLVKEMNKLGILVMFLEESFRDLT